MTCHFAPALALFSVPSAHSFVEEYDRDRIIGIEREHLLATAKTHKNLLQIIEQPAKCRGAAATARSDRRSEADLPGDLRRRQDTWRSFGEARSDGIAEHPLACVHRRVPAWLGVPLHQKINKACEARGLVFVACVDHRQHIGLQRIVIQDFDQATGT